MTVDVRLYCCRLMVPARRSHQRLAQAPDVKVLPVGPLSFGPMTDPAPQERVELFLERAEVLRSSSAVASIDQTAITLRFGGALGDADAELVAPGDEATLVYFARLRHFDTPKTDVYVRDFFPNLDAGATARRKLVVEHLSQAHADLGRRGNEWPKIVMGASATPRAVWEFWTYSQVLHTDPNKRAAWSSLNAMQQEMAKFVAFGYAGDLFHLVTVVEAMLRAPYGTTRVCRATRH